MSESLLLANNSPSLHLYVVNMHNNNLLCIFVQNAVVFLDMGLITVFSFSVYLKCNQRCTHDKKLV